MCRSGIVLLALTTQSCFLVSVPVKATGEIIEKSAYATGAAASRGIQRLRQPAAGSEPVYREPSYETYPAPSGPDYGSDAYYEQIR